MPSTPATDAALISLRVRKSKHRQACAVLVMFKARVASLHALKSRPAAGETHREWDYVCVLGLWCRRKSRDRLQST